MEIVKTIEETLGTATKKARKLNRKLRKARLFSPKNAQIDKRKEFFSPSEKYVLVVTPYSTKKGCWNYSQGTVIRNPGNCPRKIADVQRNYSHFPFLFIENHANGHDYLVCGEDYQGQTVIELDTGKRVDHLPDAASEGFGYCWVQTKYYPEAQILVAAGCIWACPYEYRFYDFSSPMDGWPELEVEEYIEDTGKWPEIDGDTVKCFLPDEDNEEEMGAIMTLKREGQKLVKVDEWVSDKEKKRREDREEAGRKYEEWLKEFRSSDPLYLTMKERVKKHDTAETHDGIGITYEGWCPDFTKKERRVTRRIMKVNGITVDLEWGVEEGPIKLCVFRDGKRVEDKFFKHSVEEMHSAFDYAEAQAGL